MLVFNAKKLFNGVKTYFAYDAARAAVDGE